METRQETIRTLSELSEDYSKLIVEYEKAERSFSEPLPQPDLLMLADGTSFAWQDCEKVIAGNYLLNEEGTPTGDEPVKLTYRNNIKKIMPCQATAPKPPKEPTPPEAIPRKPISFLISSLLVLTAIVSAILFFALREQIGARVFIFGVLVMACFIGDVVFAVSQGGAGIIALIITLIIRPRQNKKYQAEKEQYDREMAKYTSDRQKEQAEYEERVAEAEKVFEEANRKLYENVLAELEEYIELWKEYAVRKEETDQRLEKERAIAEDRYMAIREQVAGYPDFIPEKYRIVPMINEGRGYELYNTRNILQSLLAIMENGRADTLKEATNCYQSDLQAEEQRRILLDQAEDARRAAERQEELLAQQAEDARMAEAERNRFMREQAEEQDRRSRERDRMLREQAEEQKKRDEESRKLSERSACAVSFCRTCEYDGRVTCSYHSDGRGGCTHYRYRH